jgi:hypothetical protein
MKNGMRRLAVSLLFLCVTATPAISETSFQFSFAGAQIPQDPDVNGFRVSLLHGKNASMRGFDLGLVSIAEAQNASGFSMILGLSKVTGRCSGLATALVNYHTGEDSGVNAAFVNSIKTQRSGVNVGFANVTDGFSNVDISGIGISKESQVQLGFVNITEKINGVQIGFLNFAENGVFPVLPFFNFPKN